MTIAVNRNLSNCEKARKKGFRGFNGIRTRGLCVFRAFSQLLKLRFTAMVTYLIHLYFRSSHHFILCFKANFVSRIIGQFNKSALLPLCQPCLQFCFYTSFLLGLNKCFSNFHRIYNMKNLKKISVEMEKICLLALQSCQKKKLMLYIFQIQPVVCDP